MQQTLHQIAQSNFNTLLALYGTTKNGNRKRGWRNGQQRKDAMKQAVSEAFTSFGKRNSSSNYTGFRQGIDSGRNADWFQPTFERYQVTAQALHKALGLSGDQLRQAVLCVHNRESIGYNLKNAPHISGYALNGLINNIRGFGLYVSNKYSYNTNWTATWAASFEPCNGDTSIGIELLVWMAIVDHIVNPAIGEYEAKKLLSDLENNPKETISGYLASSINSWKKNESGYECCSGHQSYNWFKNHHEYWDYLITRAPVGSTGDGWEQCFPHEEERMKKLQEAGWYCTLRLNDSIYSKPTMH